MTPFVNLDWITENLAVGGSFCDDHVEHFAQELGIGHVVDLREEDCDDGSALAESGIELLHLPTRDVCAIDEAMIREGVAWVVARLGRGSRVLIHCEHGIGRSALLALCVLVARGAAPLEALRQMKRARPIVAPSRDQLAAFARFCGEWRERHGAAWKVPSFEALVAIAYRHLPASLF